MLCRELTSAQCFGPWLTVFTQLSAPGLLPHYSYGTKHSSETTFSVFSDMSPKSYIFYTGLGVDTWHLIIQEPEAGALLLI